MILVTGTGAYVCMGLHIIQPSGDVVKHYFTCWMKTVFSEDETFLVSERRKVPVVKVSGFNSMEFAKLGIQLFFCLY